MLDDIERQWSRELRAEVEIRPLGGKYEVRIDGDQFHTGTLQEIETSLNALAMFAEVERDGF